MIVNKFDVEYPYFGLLGMCGDDPTFVVIEKRGCLK